MTANERKRRLGALGYGLKRNATDCLRRKWPFSRFPTGGDGGGATLYFQTPEEVDRNIERCEQMRQWESEMPPIGES